MYTRPRPSGTEKKRGDVLRRVSSASEAAAPTAHLFGAGGHDDAAARAGASGYWERLWSEGVAPGSMFDTGGAPCAALVRHLEEAAATTGDRDALAARTALVPGCGRGYDCAALFDFGPSAQDFKR